MDKLLKPYSHEVKELDDKKGIVTAYANTYMNEDADGDISMPGSFKRTVNNNLEKIRVFKDHNRFQLLGVPMDVDADDPKGLLTTTKFNMDKQLSRDMFTDIKLMVENGYEADLSVGVIPVKRDDNDNRKVLEWKLKEYSFLSSWGANDKATVQQIKSQKQYKKFVDMVKQAYDMDYSDERLKELEQLLRALELGTDHFDSPDSTDGLAEDKHSDSELITNLHKTLITNE